MKYSTSWLTPLPWMATQQLQKTEKTKCRAISESSPDSPAPTESSESSEPDSELQKSTSSGSEDDKDTDSTSSNDTQCTTSQTSTASKRTLRPRLPINYNETLLKYLPGRPKEELYTMYPHHSQIPVLKRHKKQMNTHEKTQTNTHKKTPMETQTWMPQVNELFSNIVIVKPICKAKNNYFRTFVLSKLYHCHYYFSLKLGISGPLYI